MVEVHEDKNIVIIKQRNVRFFVSSGYVYFEKWAPRAEQWNPLFKLTIEDAAELFRKAAKVLEEVMSEGLREEG